MSKDKDLLERLASLQIELTVKELERWLNDGEEFFFDPKVMAQVTTLLKHHEVKADIREVSDLKDIKEEAIKANKALLASVREEEEDVMYVN